MGLDEEYNSVIHKENMILQKHKLITKTNILILSLNIILTIIFLCFYNLTSQKPSNNQPISVAFAENYATQMTPPTKPVKLENPTLSASSNQKMIPENKANYSLPTSAIKPNVNTQVSNKNPEVSNDEFNDKLNKTDSDFNEPKIFLDEYTQQKPNDFDEYIKLMATLETDYVRLPTIEFGGWKLPFKSGVKIKLAQGYNGAGSHQGKFALDFGAEDHLDIISAYDGVVVGIGRGEKYDQWCSSRQDCIDKGNIGAGNYLIIQSSDGSRARYYHLHPGSIPNNINKNSQLKQGDFIGQVGGTGYTCGDYECTKPFNHLHFEVESNDQNGVTIPTKFFECRLKVNKCDENGWLIENIVYLVD